MTLAEEFRDELLARDARILRSETRALLATIRSLDVQITALAEVLAARRLAGESTSAGAIARLAEYQALRARAVAELVKFARLAAELTGGGQRTNVEAAVEEARLLVAAQLPAGFTLARLGIEWQAPQPSALAVLSGRLSNGAPLERYLAQRIVRGTMARVRQTLIDGLLDNPRVTARALRTTFAGGMAQALRITRTETLGAYRTAARLSYEANPRLVKGYRRHAALDHRTCVACYLLDGTLYATESEMEEHVQGRCYLSPELVSWRELGIVGMPEEPLEPTGRERFAQLSESAQRALVRNDRQFELLRSGRIALGDLIQRRVHPDFGASLTQASARASLAHEGTLSRLPSITEITPIASLVSSQRPAA